MKKLALDYFLNKKFNRVLVISFSHRNNNSVPFFNCICDCGTKFKTNIYHLKDGHSRSCGCLQKEAAEKTRKTQIEKNGLLPFGQSAINTFFFGYKRNAIKRKIPFSLSKESFVSIVRQRCFYCGAEPSIKRKANSISKDFVLANGIDRIDNNKGYEENNCTPCCPFCNFSKKELSQTEFLEKINQIYKFRIKK